MIQSTNYIFNFTDYMSENVEEGPSHFPKTMVTTPEVGLSVENSNIFNLQSYKIEKSYRFLQ